MKQPDSLGMRALWTLLFATLVAPALAAFVLLILSLASGLGGFGPPSLKSLPFGELVATSAGRALEAYVWSAFPAALAGIALAALVVWRGTFHWLEAAVAGGVAATIVAFTSGGQALNHVTFLAVIGAVVGIAARMILARARIIE